MTPPARPNADDASAVVAASVTAFTLIANLVAGRAVRDALFLSHFDASHLPRMFVASSVVAIAAAIAFSRPLAHRGPQRMAARALFASAALQLGLFFFARKSPATASIVLYLHLAVVSTLLVSWFWAAVTERFDPRTAKRRMGSISAAATLGGVAGGLLAERMGAMFSTISLLPFLAALHVVAGLFAKRIGSASDDARVRPEDAPPEARAVLALMREPYLRNLAVLIAGVAVSSVFIDFVFKSRAQDAFPAGEPLLRFFALFYAATSVLTFLVQSLAARPLLQRTGLANTAATLPSATAGFGILALLAPGIATITVARAVESTLRSSLFRSSYELFYTPVERRVVRATKSLVDVGFDRIGEGAGAFVIHAVLVAGIAAPHSILLALAVAVAIGCLLLTPRLHAGYVATLERRLVEGGAAIDPDTAEDETTRSTILRTLSGIAAPRVFGKMAVPSTEAVVRSGVAAAPAPLPAVSDEIVEKIQELRSGDAIRARRVLALAQALDAALVPHAITLLAWDAVAPDAGRALARGADRWTGQLADALVDPESEFAVRRRVPRILARATTPRAVAALVQGLSDSRFEVRYRSAESLASLRARQPELALDSAAVWAAIDREAKGGAAKLAAQTLIDSDEEDSVVPVAGGSRDPARAAARAMLSLLSALHPRAQFTAAFDCLRGSDARARGTALEYVETFLPSALRRSVMNFLEDASARARAVEVGRALSSADLEALQRSQETIRTSLEEIRRMRSEGDST